MIWLLLSIACSAAVAVLLKTASLRDLDQFPLFATNYAVALGLGLLLSEPGALGQEPPAAIALAAGAGVFFVLGFLVFRRTIQEIGTGIAASVSRLSVAGPVLVSVAAFGEAVGLAQAMGIGLALAVLPFSGRFWPPWKQRRNGEPVTSGAAPTANVGAGPAEAGVRHDTAAPVTGVLWSIALFAVFALNDSMLKVRAELLPQSDAGVFFGVLFGVAGMISVVIALARGQHVRLETFLIGIPLGAVNYGTVFFLSRALEVIPGYQAFTINSVGVILLVVLVSRLLFGERLARHNYLFLLGSAAAIVLLRLPA